MAIWIVIGLIGALALICAESAALAWFAAFAVWIAAGFVLGIIGIGGLVALAVVLALPALLLTIVPLRRTMISSRLVGVFRRIMPKMSETERAAIEAGTVWWDAELFGGRPNWRRLLQTPAPTLSTEEQALLDNEISHLSDLSNDWESTQIWQDLSPKAWDYARSAGLLGLIIPKKYGGRAISAYAHSEVIKKLGTRCSAAAVSVMVPNSLGPAELLLHYGTEEQKNYYLPRLARGEDLPCFALTSPYAGSDAAAIPDTGVVCRRMWQGQETLGFSVTWNKRYITLAPIATILGLAFRASDPDALLGNTADLGITCALIPTHHPGVEIGRRHWPLNAVFQNGPTSGRDVFIPMDMVIGGRAQVGNGWRMLMECLAAGRAISLPSSNVGMAQAAVALTSAYAAIRRQFNVPVGQFEGIQEPLGRMGGHLYMMDAARRLSAAAIDLGEKPSVISAIAKYHVTERARIVINDAMDVVGGKGICMGPGNFLARAYQQMPIGITVEGANIMTRALIIFGQGAIRCHPYVLKLMRAANNPDGTRGLRDFDSAFFAHISFIAGNMVRALLHGVSFGRFLPAPKESAPELAPHYRAAGRLSIVLALMSDVAMATLGGTLKRRESLTGRLGDVLSQLYLISAVLKRYEDDGRPANDLPLVHWSIQDALVRAQDALDGVFANFPNRAVAIATRIVAFPLGLPHRRPADKLLRQIARLLQTDGETRDRLLAGTYLPRTEADPIASVGLAFKAYARVEAIERRLQPAIRAKALPRMPQSLPLLAEWADKAFAGGAIQAEEHHVIQAFVVQAEIAIRVDDFPADFNAAADLELRKAGTAPAPVSRNAAE